MSLTCTAVPFERLSGVEVHAVARLRQDVFVVEQACPYPDLDGRDTAPGTRHVLLTDHGDTGNAGDAGLLIGCARVLDDGDDWRIGRVALVRSARGQGLADLLMHTALTVTRGRDVVLDAQSPLAGWYATHGFEISGPEFLEDDIPHLPMRRPQARA